MAITFDPVSANGGLCIVLDATTTSYTMKEIYSAWKDWARTQDTASDYLRYPKAFDVIGGDDLGGGKVAPPFFFLRNDLGWHIKRPEADIEVTISGNLFKREAAGPALFMGPNGAFSPVITIELETVAPDDLLNQVIDGGLTFKEALSIILAATAGKGGPDMGGTYRYRDVADTKDRIVAATDLDGTRTSVTLDGA